MFTELIDDGVGSLFEYELFGGPPDFEGDVGGMVYEAVAAGTHEVFVLLLRAGRDGQWLPCWTFRWGREIERGGSVNRLTSALDHSIRAVMQVPPGPMGPGTPGMGPPNAQQPGYPPAGTPAAAAGGYGPAPGPFPPGGPSAAGAPGSEGQMKNAKIARGCGFGGCGCALVLLIVGGILFAFGMQRATREALPFSYVVLGIMPFVGIVGAALLGWGMVTLNKLKGK